MSSFFKSFIENEYYQYISIVMGTMSLLPQIILANKTKSLRDVSPYTLVMIFTSGTLWSLYMYETKRIIYFPCTLFLTINSLILMSMKATFYRNRLISSMERLDNPTSINLST